MFQTLDLAKTGLSSSTVKSIQNCLANFKEIELCILYGSRAKGTYRNGSDIDLCLIGKNLTANILLKIETALDDLLTPYSFDICIYDQIDSPSLKEHIDRVGLKFFKTD